MSKLRTLILTVLLVALAVVPASAHQPFFEGEDIQPDQPWQIKDATVSTAIYATLDRRGDVDTYTFVGRRGQSILLSITIPQIAGQELFAPEMALLGPGLTPGTPPPGVSAPAGAGVYALPALTGRVTSSYEPFSRTSYWPRQRQRVTLPADGVYVVAAWSAAGEVGRYVFVIGDREIPGGDPTYILKMGDYMQPVATPAVEPLPAAVEPAGHSCGK